MGSNLAYNRADEIEVDRELASRSLVDFMKLAWPIVEPARKFVSNWHIDAMSEYFMAITRGEISRLVINVPPGMTKSMMTNVFFPCWEWGPCNLSHYRYICASYRLDLSIRDNIKARRLITSEWYQTLWPMGLMPDQDTKIKFENEHTGYKVALPPDSTTGERGDRVLIDDPHSVKGALSELDRKSTIIWFSESIPTRLNDPILSAIIVIMQRQHEQDVTGYVIAEELGYELLVLPMEFETKRRFISSIGFEDPRTKEGELLFPERFPQDVVERDKKVLGLAATAGQFQQRPTPRGGGMIKAEMLAVGEPAQIVRSIRYWDKAGTEDGGAYTAGAHIGIDVEGMYWVLDIVRGQWSAHKREKFIKQTAEIDGTGVEIWVEQEPGSGGKESAESTIQNLAGYVIRADKVTGAKEVRAEAFSIQVEAGNVKLKRGAWNKPYIDEAQSWPVSKYKDQIDASAGGFNKLALQKRWLPAKSKPKDEMNDKPIEPVFYPMTLH